MPFFRDVGTVCNLLFGNRNIRLPKICEQTMANRFDRVWKTFFRSEEGVTAVEYAILLAVIAIFSISAILATGDMQQALWFNTADEMSIITP